MTKTVKVVYVQRVGGWCEPTVSPYRPIPSEPEDLNPFRE